MIGSGIGEFTIGGFPDEDSLSVADPLPGLITDPSLEREFLLRAVPHGAGSIAADSGLLIVTDAGDAATTDPGTLVNVDLSSSGYSSLPTDTPYKLFQGAISRPYNFSVQLPLPDLSGGVILGGGEILLNNPDGLLDDIALYDWLGADLQEYIGRRDDSLLNFTRFFSGVSAGVMYDLDTISILHRDIRFRLQKRLQPNRYMGTGACLRFGAVSTDQVSYGDILDPDATQSFTAEILFRATDTAANKFIFSKKSAGGVSAGWRLTVALTYFTIECADGTNSVSALVDGSAYLDGKLHRATLVIDRTAQLMYLYIDGDLVLTSGSISGIGSLASASALIVGNRGLGSQPWVGDLDDFRYWSIARAQVDIQRDMHKEITGTETGLEIYTPYNEGDLTTAGDLTVNGRDGTITGCSWIGSLEGDSSLVGTPKPIVVGVKRNISPKLVDPQNNVYQWHDGLGQALDVVKDSGDPYTFGSEVGDIYDSVPSPGQYTVARSVNGSYFRLESSAIGIITCDVRGDAGGSLGYVDTLSGIHRKIATQYGGLSDSSLNLDTYAALTVKTSAKVGWYFDAEINTDAALDQICKEGGSAWWTGDRVSRISVGRIDPPEDLPADITVTINDLVEPRLGGTFKRNPVGVRVGQVVLGYRHYNTTLTNDQVSGAVDAATGNDLGQEYRFVTATDPLRSADADTLTIRTELDDPADAQAEADRLLSLWKIDRSTLAVTMVQGVLSYFIGTVFEVLMDRYDLTSGKKFIAYGIAEDMGQHAGVDRLEPALFG